jgi:hypothetical protein
LSLEAKFTQLQFHLIKVKALGGMSQAGRHLTQPGCLPTIEHSQPGLEPLPPRRQVSRDVQVDASPRAKEQITDRFNQLHFDAVPAALDLHVSRVETMQTRSGGPAGCFQPKHEAILLNMPPARPGHVELIELRVDANSEAAVVAAL